VSIISQHSLRAALTLWPNLFKTVALFCHNILKSMHYLEELTNVITFKGKAIPATGREGS
jgi:hypothetical protein